MSDLRAKDFLEAMQADTKENLRRQLRDAHIMVMAIMDELELESIMVTRKTYMNVSGGLESYSKFDLNITDDGFELRRTK